MAKIVKLEKKIWFGVLVIVILFLTGCQAHYEDITLIQDGEELYIDSIDIDGKKITISASKTIIHISNPPENITILEPEIVVSDEDYISIRDRCPKGEIYGCTICGDGRALRINENCGGEEEIEGTGEEPEAEEVTERTNDKGDLEIKTCPSSCDDENKCTMDYCSSETNFECKHNSIEFCCGNQECEGNETFLSCPNDCEPLYPDVQIDEIKILPTNPGNDELVYISVIVSNHGSFVSGSITILVDGECIMNGMGEFENDGSSTITGLPCPFGRFTLQSGESRELYTTYNDLWSRNKYIPNFGQPLPFWYTGDNIGEHKIKVILENDKPEYDYTNNELTRLFTVEEQGDKELFLSITTRPLQGGYYQNAVIEIELSVVDNEGYPVFPITMGYTIYHSDYPNTPFEGSGSTYRDIEGKYILNSPVLTEKGNYTIYSSTNAIIKMTEFPDSATYSFEIY